MQFSLSKSGPVSECRQALQAAVTSSGAESPDEQQVVRAAAHVISGGLDRIEAPHQAKLNALRAANLDTSAEREPSAVVSASISISYSAQ